MAGAGKRTFIAGEVLTAAQVNDFLMDQAVMRFSGSAARAASITAPTEGMVTYLDSTNRLYIYDGAAWQEMPTDQDDLRNVVTASGQILVGAATASVIAVGGAAEGQVLTAASAQPGGVAWQTPSGAGAAIFKLIAATGTTALPAELTPGFYRISYGTATLTQTQLRFVDTFGNYYGASISSGDGFVTIPTAVASVNITASAGSNLLVEELPGVTATLPAGPTVTDFEWTGVTGGSVTFTTGITPQRVGYYNVQTGSLHTSSVVTSPFSSLFFTSSAAAFGSNARFTFVQQNSDGLWSESASLYAASAFDTLYPFQTFTGNGTYTPPSWSASADVLLVAGGGGGGNTTDTGATYGGGGGAGGVKIFTNIATPASVSITVGGGGAAGTSGNPSLFGTSASTVGGGAGGTNPDVNPTTGGSGGGGHQHNTTGGNVGAAGTANQGFAGGDSQQFSGVTNGGGGGGATETGNTDGRAHGGDGGLFFHVLAGGGGAGGWQDGSAPGGDGGGGAGGAINSNGTAGTQNTGGGGGGSSSPNQGSRAGGAGGSGLVIVRAK